MAAKEWSSGLTPEARLLHWYLCLCCVAISSHLLLPFPVPRSLALVPTPHPTPTSVIPTLSESADCPSCVGNLPGLWQIPAALSYRHNSQCAFFICAFPISLHLSFWKWALSLRAPHQHPAQCQVQERLTEWTKSLSHEHQASVENLMSVLRWWTGKQETGVLCDLWQGLPPL